MRLGSFCTGYGGLDMAVEAHYGAHLAWYSEVDKDCNQLLAHHWPRVPNLGDLTAIDWDQVEPVDIICAGFPCQPFSHAGKRQGADDERAIFQYIADAVSVLRPGIVVLENVAGILTLGGPGVVGSLAALGYDLRWGVVRASDAGAPHRRARWFCVACDTDSVAGELPVEGDRRSGEVEQPGTVERTLRSDGGVASNTDSLGAEGNAGTVSREPRGADRSTTDSSSQRHGGRKNGRGLGHLDRRDESQTRQRQRTRPEPVDRGAASVADTDGERLPQSQLSTVAVQSEQPRAASFDEGAPIAAALGPQGVRTERRLEEASGEPRRLSRFGPYEPAIERWGRILGRRAPDPTDDRGLRPGFVEWMMGLPDGHVCDLGLSRTAELKMLGNGVVPAQAALALTVLDDR